MDTRGQPDILPSLTSSYLILSYLILSYLILSCVIVAPCDFEEGWKQENNKCYLFDVESRSYHIARSFCEEKGATLVTIEDEAEETIFDDIGAPSFLPLV